MKRFVFAVCLALVASTCAAGTRDLKEDTAVVIVVGPFVDIDGAAVTAPTIASIDITGYKNDGTAVGITPAASGSSNDMVHVDDGYFSLELTTTDTSTPGYYRLTFQISGSLIFHEDFNILPANIYDSRYSTAFQKVDVETIKTNPVVNGGTVTFPSNATLGTSTLTQAQVTGGAYDLDTDANGRIRIVDGTGAGEIDTTSGLVNLHTAQGAITFSDLNVTDPVNLAGGLALTELSITEGAVIATSDSDESALVVTGNGTGHGAIFTSGSGATGEGARFVAASTNGVGLYAIGSGTQSGLRGKGGATGHGFLASGGDTSGDGFRSTATTDGKGINAIAAGSAQPGFLNSGAGTGAGIQAVSGGGATGTGILATSAATNGEGFAGFGGGTGAGAFLRGGATGNAIRLAGGPTSGDGISLTTTDGDGITIAATGASQHGVQITGGNSGTSDGLKITAGSGGVSINSATVDAIKAVTDLFTAAQTEPTGAPAANETPLEKIGFLFATMRNKVTVTATEKTVYDDADAEQWDKELSDNGTTYTETEAAAAD